MRDSFMPSWEHPDPARHRPAVSDVVNLNQLAANVRQWPCGTPAEVEQLFQFVERMATDCGWQPTAMEVVAQQNASRVYIRDRVLGMVAERRLEPYKLAAIAEAVLRMRTQSPLPPPALRTESRG